MVLRPQVGVGALPVGDSIVVVGVDRPHEPAAERHVPQYHFRDREPVVEPFQSGGTQRVEEPSNPTKPEDAARDRCDRCRDEAQRPHAIAPDTQLLHDLIDDGKRRGVHRKRIPRERS